MHYYFFPRDHLRLFYRILRYLLIMNSLINCLLFSRFIQKFSKSKGNIRVTFKNMVSLYLCYVSTIVFSSSWFIFILFWPGIFNYLAFYNNFDHVFLIYFFLVSTRLQKVTVHAFFRTAKYPSSASPDMLHCWLSASMDTLQHMLDIWTFFLAFSWSFSSDHLGHINLCINKCAMLSLTAFWFYIFSCLTFFYNYSIT